MPIWGRFGYESHTPIRVNRAKYREIAKLFVHTERAAAHRYHGICCVSAYWNILGLPEGQPRRWANDVRLGFSDSSRNHNPDMISAQLPGKTFLFHNDEGLNEPLKTVIQALFPDRSRFEL